MNRRKFGLIIPGLISLAAFGISNPAVAQEAAIRRIQILSPSSDVYVDMTYTEESAFNTLYRYNLSVHELAWASIWFIHIPKISIYQSDLVFDILFKHKLDESGKFAFVNGFDIHINRDQDAMDGAMFIADFKDKINHMRQKYMNAGWKMVYTES